MSSDNEDRDCEEEEEEEKVEEEGVEETDGGALWLWFWKCLIEALLHSRTLGHGSEAWEQTTDTHCSRTDETRAPQEGDVQIATADLRSVERVSELSVRLQHPRANPNSIERGESVVHTYASRGRDDLLLYLILNTNCCINVPDKLNGNTPLHIAAKLNNKWIVKLLIAFGAKIDKLNKDGLSPVDMAHSCIQAVDTTLVQLLKDLAPLARPQSIDLLPPGAQRGVNRNRMLFLDGGGVRGLVEIEILMEIERRTRRRIVDLFDWIVGTSIGAVIALGLVYGQLPLEALKHTLLRARSSVFGSKLPNKRSTNMEEMLKDLFGSETRMSSKRPPHVPRVMALAIHKKTDKFEHHFFNNCFNNPPFSTQLVWKVARYVSAAAPFYFTELDHYIDGGFQANNPSQTAWTEIHERLAPGEDLNPSLVVSVGTGLPSEKYMKKLALSNIPRNILQGGALLNQLIGNSDVIARNFKAERVKDGTPYYRFDPLDIDIGPVEDNVHKLVDMIIQTKLYLSEEKQVTDMQQIADKLNHE